MDIPTRRSTPVWLLILTVMAIAVITILVSNMRFPPGTASAHSGDVFGPACGVATLDGVINPGEWSSASKQTFQMYSPGSEAPLTATLYVMNSGYYLYLGITVNDDEFSDYGQYLPDGDTFRIDFDNDHSGSLFALGADVLNISAGFPQFRDNYICGQPASSSTRLDVQGDGASDGGGAAGRTGNLNHFELRHPLCSGDSLDFCLHPADTVGFRLEYFDAEADGSFGGSQSFPGSSATSEADIVIGQCSGSDLFIYLPLVQK